MQWPKYSKDKFLVNPEDLGAFMIGDNFTQPDLPVVDPDTDVIPQMGVNPTFPGPLPPAGGHAVAPGIPTHRYTNYRPDNWEDPEDAPTGRHRKGRLPAGLLISLGFAGAAFIVAGSAWMGRITAPADARPTPTVTVESIRPVPKPAPTVTQVIAGPRVVVNHTVRATATRTVRVERTVTVTATPTATGGPVG